jgi:mannose-6-phosphate isomerase-like protein (cupin superfamily)
MTLSIINLGDCPQFITKDRSKIREIMAPRNSSIERQSLAEAVVQVGCATDEHYHSKSEEIYYILSGIGEIRVDGETAPVKPGDAIALPPECAHKIWNRGDCELVFLCLCVPSYEHDDTVITER